MELKTIVLYDRTRVLPQTLEAIIGADEKSITIPVDRQELDAWTVLQIPVLTKTEARSLRAVVLCNRQRIAPDTLLAIAESENGSLIPVDPVELDSFTVMVFHLPGIKKLAGKK